MILSTRQFWLGVAAVVVYSVMGLATIIGVHRGTQAHVPAAPVISGVFEGQGTLTLGCALWQPAQTDPDEWPGDSKDFYLEADRGELFAIVVLPGDGHARLLMGEQCGVSTDYTRIPQE